MVLLRRPPKMIALIGTPSPFSKSGSRTGLFRTGAVNRLLGWAAFSFESGVQSLPRQSIACFGGASSLPSHQTSRSEEHTSELQSQSNLVCRLLLEKKKQNNHIHCIL